MGRIGSVMRTTCLGGTAQLLKQGDFFFTCRLALPFDRHKSYFCFAVAGEDDLLTSLCAADEFGELGFRLNDGQVHGVAFLDQNYGP